jgi:predicted lipoprotein with Yx(FWY)xxD motif
MLTKLRTATLVSIAAVGLLTAGCGAADQLTGSANANQQKAASPSASASNELTPALGTQSNDQLGEIVVDDKGRTLYRFDQDTNNPAATNCVDACADKWPPVLAGEKVSVDGVDSELIGTVDRPDGSQQVTLKGWPLYRFADDKQAGDIKGQGVEGTWFVAAPNGAKAPAAQQDQQQDEKKQDDKQQDDKQDDQGNQDDQNDQGQEDDDSGYGY